ncbi:MAG: transcription-repair coupling factor, partial [Butyricicoccus sp.]|nr:transcription-repair coupling factor [Butyricicoccus sp.]
CAADLTLSANLPSEYVSDAGQRVDLYRRIALIRTGEQRSDLLDELIDRYGEPPAPAVALLDIALLRARASELGVTEIKQEHGRLLVSFEQADFVRLSILCGDKQFKGRLLLNAGSKPYVSLRLNPNEQALPTAQKLLETYADTAGVQ